MATASPPRLHLPPEEDVSQHSAEMIRKLLHIVTMESGEKGNESLRQVLSVAPSLACVKLQHGMLLIHVMALRNKTVGFKLAMVITLLSYFPKSANLRAYGATPFEIAEGNEAFEDAAVEVLRLAAESEGE